MKIKAIYTPVIMLLLAMLFASASFAEGKDGFVSEEVALSPAERATLHEQLKWDDECEEGYKFHLEYNPDDKDTKLYKINPELTLVEIPCDYAAYQANYIYMTYNPSAVHPKATARNVKIEKIHQYPDENDGSILGMPIYSMKQNTLVNLEKYRGIGDCGLTSYWTLDAENAKFVLDKAEEMDCDRSRIIMDRCMASVNNEDKCFDRVLTNWKVIYRKSKSKFKPKANS